MLVMSINSCRSGKSNIAIVSSKFGFDSARWIASDFNPCFTTIIATPQSNVHLMAELRILTHESNQFFRLFYHFALEDESELIDHSLSVTHFYSSHCEQSRVVTDVFARLRSAMKLS